VYVGARCHSRSSLCRLSVRLSAVTFRYKPTVIAYYYTAGSYPKNTLGLQIFAFPERHCGNTASRPIGLDVMFTVTDKAYRGAPE